MCSSSGGKICNHSNDFRTIINIMGGTVGMNIGHMHAQNMSVE